jgi:D-tyrosyl-tRNA(Tyr) deacylase
MRAVIQRVSQSSVVVDQQIVGQTGPGLLVLLGVEQGDTESDLDYLVKKTVNLRIFNDEQGKMNLALREVQGKLLLVSQFTLLGDVRQGNRPSFIQAAPPEHAQAMYEQFVNKAQAMGVSVETGQFRAEMQVHLINQGPVTIIIDSRQR